jgi:subtilisin family serine protease
MSKLAPPVETALSLWRTRTASGAAETSPAGEQLIVIVTYEGDMQQLAQAGLASGFDSGGTVTGRIAFRDLERLAAVPSVVYIEKEPDFRPTLDGTITEMRVPWKVPPTTPWPGRGAGVIVAVIDTGIDIFHQSFRTAVTTRILELWDQSATTGGSLPPAGFDQIGRVFSQAQINAGIAANPPFASIDKVGHGTHVAGIAAGNGQQDDRCSSPGHYVGVAPDADLVIVKAIELPPGSRANISDALRWCSQAGARHGNKPVVINCSFGTSTGPHDGTGPSDRFVDAVLVPRTNLNGAVTAAATSITVSAFNLFPPAGNYHIRIGAETLLVTAGQGTLTWTVTRGVDGTTAAAHANGDAVTMNAQGLAVVCSAGNHGDTEIHERGTLNGNSSTTLSFTIPEHSAKDDELDIWYNGAAALTITLTAPPNPDQSGPITTGPIAPGAANVQLPIGLMTIHASSAAAPSPVNNQRNINVRISVIARTILNAAITAAATSITVTAFTGFPPTGNFRIKIGAETMLVTGGQGTLTWTVTRGVDGTTSAAHANGDTVEQADNLFIRPGEWQLTLSNTTAVPANWRAWFGSRDAHPTFRLEDESDMVEHRRNDTIGQPGSSRNAITVANYSDSDGLIASSSSRGGTPPVQQQWQASVAHVVGDHVIPTGTQTGLRYRCTTAGTSGTSEPTFPTTLGQTVADGGVVWEAVGALVHELKPTIAAPGSGVAAPRSQNDPKSNSSCCDQKVIDKSGTSMAAPHVAGLVALMLEKNGTLNFEQIRGHLQRTTRIDGIPAGEVPPVFDALLNIRAGHIWGAGKVNAAQALAEIFEVAFSGGGGGGGGGDGGGSDHYHELSEDAWGYTPHTIFSRLGEWRTRIGPRPGLMLMASLVSEHFDEVLRLINHNRKVGTVWRRGGGPLLARHLLFSHQNPVTPLPAAIDGCNVCGLIRNVIPILKRFGGPKLKRDIDRYASFAHEWPGATVESLDAWALALKGEA